MTFVTWPKYQLQIKFIKAFQLNKADEIIPWHFTEGNWINSTGCKDFIFIEMHQSRKWRVCTFFAPNWKSGYASSVVNNIKAITIYGPSMHNKNNSVILVKCVVYLSSLFFLFTNSSLVSFLSMPYGHDARSYSAILWILKESERTGEIIQWLSMDEIYFKVLKLQFFFGTQSHAFTDKCRQSYLIEHLMYCQPV